MLENQDSSEGYAPVINGTGVDFCFYTRALVSESSTGVNIPCLLMVTG